jgi:hypothetical protein
MQESGYLRTEHKKTEGRIADNHLSADVSAVSHKEYAGT